MARYKVNKMFVTGCNGIMYTKGQTVYTACFPEGRAKVLCDKGSLVLDDEFDNGDFGPISTPETLKENEHSVKRAIADQEAKDRKPDANFKTKESDVTDQSEESGPPKSKWFEGADGNGKWVNSPGDILKDELKYALDQAEVDYNSSDLKSVLFDLWMSL